MIAIMSNGFVAELARMAERRFELEQGNYLFHRGDRVEHLYVVKTGMLELARPQPDGKLVVLQRADHDAVLAEASLYSDFYHCDAIATLPSIVMALSRTALLARLSGDGTFSRLWSSHLAREMMKARYRSEILARKTVSERLDAWLAWHDNGLPPKGEWKSIAVQIGVSPEAFYRELSKRR